MNASKEPGVSDRADASQTRAGEPAGGLSRPSADSPGQRKIAVALLLVGVLVLAGVIALRFRTRSEGAGKQNAQTLRKDAAASGHLGDQPVIPLELLFPERSASRPQGPASANAANGGAHRPPIPATAQAVAAEARQVAEGLVDRFSGSADSLEIAARMHLWLGDSDRAAAAWDACLALDSRYQYAYEGLGTLAAKRGDHEEAVRLYRKALEIDPNGAGATPVRIRLAQSLIDHGQFEEAIETLEPAMQLIPVPTEALVLLGMAYLQSQDYAKARQFYEAAIASYPTHANAHFGLATACRRLGETESANKYLERFRELRSGERKIRTDQRSQYDDVEEMRVNLAQMHTNAGRVYVGHGDLPEAERHWRRAAALDPTALDCRQAIAWFCQQGGRTREAIAMLEELREIEPDEPAYPLEVGRLQMVLGEYDEAENTFRSLCENMPERADGYASLAKLYLKAKRFPDRAESLAATAARLEPSLQNHLLHAAACERNGNLDGAAEAVERILRVAPNDPVYQQIYQKLTETP